jgi:uncharacterized membrane protein
MVPAIKWKCLGKKKKNEMAILLLLWLHGPFSLTLASLLIAVHSFLSCAFIMKWLLTVAFQLSLIFLINFLVLCNSCNKFKSVFISSGSYKLIGYIHSGVEYDIAVNLQKNIQD